MTAEALRHAEVVKLSRVLDTVPAALDCLEPLDRHELRELRGQLTQALYDRHRKLFERIARSGRMLPAVVVATLSEKVFGPLISARTAGMMPPARAVAVAEKLSLEFQAELSLAMDPRSAPSLLKRMPIPIIVGTARILQARGEYITMARFVDSLSDEAIAAVVADTEDDEALVRIGFYVELPEQLGKVITLLPSERLRRMVALTTMADPELQAAGVVMLCHVPDPVKGLMGDAAAFQGEDLLRTLVANLRREKVNDALQAMLAHMSAEGRALALRVGA